MYICPYTPLFTYLLCYPAYHFADHHHFHSLTLPLTLLLTFNVSFISLAFLLPGTRRQGDTFLLLIFSLCLSLAPFLFIFSLPFLL
jgi:hypothetical protein